MEGLDRLVGQRFWAPRAHLKWLRGLMRAIQLENRPISVDGG